MNQQQQQEHFEKLVDRLRKTLLLKGNDYSGKGANADRLYNFKAPAQLLNVPTAKIALSLMAVKISRLITLLDSEGSPNFEAIDDTSMDLVAYAILNDAIINEEKQK